MLNLPSRTLLSLRFPGFSEVWIGGNLSWRLLLHLRWLALVGQGVTLLMAAYLGAEVAWAHCGFVLALTLVSNAFLEGRWRRGSRFKSGFFELLILDTLLVALLLQETGGLSNPFAVFFLVHLTLAAATLRTRAAVSLGLMVMALCAILGTSSRKLQLANGEELPERLWEAAHLTAIILAGGFILLMLLVVRGRTQRLQAEADRLRTELAERDRFLSVATLATGFAHELATPLGTISLAVENLGDDRSGEATRTIARETARCQNVLTRLRTLGEETGMGADSPVSVRILLQDLLAELPESQRDRLIVWRPAGEVGVAAGGIREALLVLIRNAFLASPTPFPVTLTINASDGLLSFGVRDAGPGFPADMLQHLGEPFRSGREPGEGLGLGLFFARRLAVSRGGSLQVINPPEGGALVTLSIPFHTGTGVTA